MSEIKRGKGRPPFDFKDEYCEDLVQHMSEGLSFESFAGKLGICKDTLYNLLDKYPHFSDAKKRGFELNRLFWEKIGIENILNESFGNNQGSKSLNATVYIFNLKNRFPQEWRDRKEIDATATVNSNVNQNTNITITQENVLDIIRKARS